MGPGALLFLQGLPSIPVQRIDSVCPQRSRSYLVEGGAGLEHSTACRSAGRGLHYTIGSATGRPYNLAASGRRDQGRLRRNRNGLRHPLKMHTLVRKSARKHSDSFSTVFFVCLWGTVPGNPPQRALRNVADLDPQARAGLARTPRTYPLPRKQDIPCHRRSLPRGACRPRVCFCQRVDGRRTTHIVAHTRAWLPLSYYRPTFPQQQTCSREALNTLRHSKSTRREGWFIPHALVCSGLSYLRSDLVNSRLFPKTTHFWRPKTWYPLDPIIPVILWARTLTMPVHYPGNRSPNPSAIPNSGELPPAK